MIEFYDLKKNDGDQMKTGIFYKYFSVQEYVWHSYIEYSKLKISQYEVND